MVSYVGSRPMPVVATPIRVSARTSIGLRPFLSPSWPATMPPIGRARKPTAKVAKAARTPAVELPAGKYRSPRTSAAAMPKTK